ncbi:MAG: ABC transporter ATP-binding protein [Solirubrobacterales bacterium]|nr:ABC transporter ATP-binding protein [Solirubrobacterales bacterium]HMT05578.1 ABC transporter ATP-binding protein [Solirubrobacterales bacterium]
MQAGSKLRIEGLSKTYRGTGGGENVTALKDVGIEIGAGEFVSIVGPSGCGKSTLFNIIAGLIRPSGGKVLLDGRQPDELLGSVGYMPQRDCLMPWRTVLDNTTLGLELNGVRKKEAHKQALAEFERFGLSGFEKHWPAKLSGGMKQRAALLRTFLAGRDVMLLDEPFGALDALTRANMQQWLLDVWQEDRKTILFVTHDVEEAIYLSDRVYVMSGRPGRVSLDIEVSLSRPRKPEITMSPEFLLLKQKLLRPLEEAAAGGGLFVDDRPTLEEQL